ncbi:multimeric flavodoxin WrbA [Elusimicrobium posterum]|uniref:flavodoxin family protein n=1 Tax=Elusimicrobium posterum TaxID=3116653 RepID=UPI003C737591
MKVVAFNGSPRKGGNTQIALETVLKPLQDAGIETEIIQVGGSGIKPCTACYWCRKEMKGRCVMDDDALNGWLQKMIEADAIIIGSPTYFAELTPETKALIDRAGFAGRGIEGSFKRKVGSAIAINRRAGAMKVLEGINKFFLINDMFVAGSTYWNMAFGMDKGEVVNDEEGMQTFENLGNNILWFLQNVKK